MIMLSADKPIIHVHYTAFAKCGVVHMYDTFYQKYTQVITTGEKYKK
jgi:hypothetical protein